MSKKCQQTFLQSLILITFHENPQNHRLSFLSGFVRNLLHMCQSNQKKNELHMLQIHTDRACLFIHVYGEHTC
jgi:hypothetical protein